jgi:hypothetical protein
MREQGRLRAIHCRLVIAGIGLLMVGCSEELGSVPMRVTRVRGVVREGNHPVSRGWIEFVPVEGTVGNLRSARIHPDGSFETDRVPVGKNLVRLINAPIEPPGAARLFSSFLSPIRRVIPEEPTAPLTIDLVEEAILYNKSRLSASSPESKESGSRP